MRDNNANTKQFNQWINRITGTSSVASRHYFASSQYVFPTKEMYSKMQATGYWTRQYEDLRRQYEDLRRPFNPPTMTTDVWICPITAPSEDRIHPTQKPNRIIKTILETSIKSNGGGGE